MWFKINNLRESPQAFRGPVRAFVDISYIAAIITIRLN